MVSIINKYFRTLFGKKERTCLLDYGLKKEKKHLLRTHEKQETQKNGTHVPIQYLKNGQED